MTLGKTRTWVSAVVGAVVIIGAIVLGQTAMRGQTDKWYPSRWGANDQRGAANRMNGLSSVPMGALPAN